MPKILTQLVTNSMSTITASTGASGGGVSYDVSVLATGQSTTSGYGSLSYSNVSTVQHGTFANGTIDTDSTNYSSAATGVSRFTFDTEGIYVVEFVSYGANAAGGFQFVDLHRNGSTSVDEVICYQGIYASYNRKYVSVIRKFEDGDALTFFTGQNSSDHTNLSRILIAKIG